MRFAILPVGLPTKNNRVYTREALEDALKRANEKWIPVTDGVSTFQDGAAAINLKDVIGQAREFKIEHKSQPMREALCGVDSIASDEVVTCQLVVDQNSELLKLLLEGKIAARPMGIGSYEEGSNVVNDYEMTGVSLTNPA